MRILAFSDIHRDKDAVHAIVEASQSADLVIGAGDFATHAMGALEVLPLLRDCSVPVLLVHGNHDDPDEINGFCADWKDGHYLHGTSVEFDGIKFFGLGGEIPSRNTYPWNASETEEYATRILSQCPEQAVLITHTPPYGTADLQKDGSHEGSIAIRDAISTRNIRLSLCGHIHNAWGMSGKVANAKVHNLGPTINWFEI